MSYRFVYIGLGLLALAIVALAAVFAQEGDAVEVPAPLEAIAPEPGSRVIAQAVVEVDLEVGHVATIYIDGLPIPDPAFVEATGVYTWAPHPGSPVLNEWTPGEHTVRVEWRRIVGTPAVGEFEWAFRVG